jgi:hypothetical protein
VLDIWIIQCVYGTRALLVYAVDATVNQEGLVGSLHTRFTAEPFC